MPAENYWEGLEGMLGCGLLSGRHLFVQSYSVRV